MTNDHPDAPSVSLAAHRGVPDFGQLDTYGKAARSILEVLALASACAGVLLVLVLNQYLAAFGQPALASVSEVIGFVSAMFPFFLKYVGVLALLAGIPAAIRWVISLPCFGEHPFGNAYGWLPKNASVGQKGGLRAYGFAHLPSLAIAGLVAIWLLVEIEDEIAEVLIFTVFFALIAVISANDLVRKPLASPKEAGKRFGANFVTALFINFGMLWWMVLLAQLALHAAPEFGHGLLTFALAGGLLVGHVAMSAAPRRLSWALGLVTAAATIYLAGAIPITAAALREANLGGGRPTIYRASEGGAPVVACEILSIGDARILWLPDKVGELPPSSATPKKKANEKADETKAPCDWAVFRERARDGAEWASDGDPAAADAVRVFSREALYDKP